jgi:hypothetical protein
LEVSAAARMLVLMAASVLTGAPTTLLWCRKTVHAAVSLVQTHVPQFSCL